MKENIQRRGDEVAIVIYDAPLPPKYFRLTRRFIKTLFVAAPLLLTTVFIGLFLWGLGNRLKDTPAPVLPEVISQADSKILALEAELKNLKESNQALADKLAQGPAISTAEDPFLGPIKKPYGMQNLLAQNRVTLDQLELVQVPGKINFKFQIISATPERRVSGHVLVFMVSQDGVIAYPAEANAALTQGVKYSLGETFAVSRLRPTTAEFALEPSGNSVKFLIYIFNREGDLLLIRETESFKIGAKS